MFPATVFVSVASGHLTLLAVGQVLQRSLEPAEPASPQGGGAVRAADRGRPETLRPKDARNTPTRGCPDMGKAPWGVCSEGLPVRVVRRRATLPHP
ncbi:hypothetical protein GBI47_06035, partial [Bifidobacterium longum]